jgi:hypothetical protein
LILVFIVLSLSLNEAMPSAVELSGGTSLFGSSFALNLVCEFCAKVKLEYVVETSSNDKSALANMIKWSVLLGCMKEQRISRI